MFKKSESIAYYISSHGRGHFARSLEIIKNLADNYNIFVSSDLPEKLFEDIKTNFFLNTYCLK